MRADAATILIGMGYKLDRDFEAHFVNPGSSDVRWFAQTPQPTEAEIDAAAPAILAAIAADQSDATQRQTDRETLKTQIAQEIADIDTFLAIASPNNAAVLAEVRAIDRRLKAILKYIRRL